MRPASTCGVLLIVAVAGSACAQSLSLEPPVYLPDGSEFKTWVDEISYSKTYWVDRHHPQVSDENPGTFEAPFKTIGRAAGAV